MLRAIQFYCLSITSLDIVENTFRTETGREFLPTVLFDSQSSSKFIAARFALSRNLQLRILMFVTVVKAISSSAAAKATSFGGI